MRESVHISNKLNEARNSLIATTCDIEKAANYCSDAYLHTPGKDKLENSMAFATKSVAEVARQINHFADCYLDALNQQSGQLSELMDNISRLKMFCNIHQEKVARKAIGSCTIAKVPMQLHRDIPQPEYPQKYTRQPLNYNLLDSVGHGFASQPQNETLNQYGQPYNSMNTLTRQGGGSVARVSPRQGSAVFCRSVSSKTGLEYAAPMNNMKMQSNTMGRTAGIYRTAGLPPQHLLNPAGSASISQHISGGASPSGGSMSSSNYAPVVMTSNNVSSGEVNYSTTWAQSRRSSGSSSAGSNAVQQHSHYASNQHIQQSNYGQPSQVLHTNQTKHQYLPPGTIYASGPNSSQPSSIVSIPQDSYAGQMELQNTIMTQHQLIQQQQRQGRWVPTHSGVVQQQSVQEIRDSTLQRQQTVELAQDVANMHLSREQPLMIQNNQIQRPPEQYAASGQYNYQSEEYNHQQQQQHQPMESREQAAKNDCLIPKKPEDPVWAPNFYIEKVITVYEYTRDKDDELTFTENQLIYVIKKNDDGWWEGVMNGITGLFPGNYVESWDYE